MSTVSRRYVEWKINRINGGESDSWKVIRRENTWPNLIGTYPTLPQAHAAAEVDRATVLADSMATEFKSLEIDIRAT